MCWSPPNILVTLSPPTYWQTEICADIQEEFEGIYIRANAFKNKTDLCAMHFKNIQCTIIKKGAVGAVYV